MTETITAYKGFDGDFTCRGFQYEVGQTYEHDGPVEICESGFHACENPIDVFGYYAPGASRFAEVKCEGKISQGNDKIASAKITVVAEIALSDMIQRAVQSVMDAAKWIKGSQSTGDSGAASATGYSGAASATGYSGAASATGDSGAASATGKHSVALGAGWGSSALAADGCALFLVERDDDDSILHVFSGVAGRDGLKADTWYTLTDGKPVEVKS